MVSCHIAHIHKARRESRPVATPRTGGIFSAGSLCAAQRLGSHNAACLHATRAEQRPGCSDSRQCQRGRSRSTMASAPWKGDLAPVQLAHSGGARVKFPRAGITARASNPKGSRLLKTGVMRPGRPASQKDSPVPLAEVSIMTGGPANVENGRDY